jgi:hypothetical protein
VALFAIKVAPVMLRIGDFEKVIRDNADRGNRLEYTDKVITKNILGEAEDLDIPLTADKINIKRGGGRIVVTVEFTKPIEFPGYTYYYHKVIREDRPLF